MKHLTIRRAAFAVVPFALACATSKPAPPPPAPAPVAPTAAQLSQSGLAVTHDADITLKDSSRNRDLAVRVNYPEGAGPFPVIVFSHGAGGSARTYEALARFWATHGFVVLAPDHADPGAAAKDPASDSLREPAADATPDPKSWETRARDLAFVAAATAAVETRVTALKDKLDPTRVGVGGQSYGAFAAMLVAGAVVDVSKKPKSFADPIPKAFLLVSPPGKGQQGLTDKSWTSLERPLMVLTGTRDVGAKNQDASWRLDAYQLSPPGGKYAVFIEGASHLSFTGLAAEPSAAPPKSGGKKVSADAEVDIFKDMKIATLAFWDAYLKDDPSAKAFLQTDALMTESGNRAQLLRR
jgi:predicted dienelactone hydrolase